MPRAAAILKYLPAVLCGLLVVAWVASLSQACSLRIPAPGGVNLEFCLNYGSIAIDYDWSEWREVIFNSARYNREDKNDDLGQKSWLGNFPYRSIKYTGHGRQRDRYPFASPVPLILTFIFPFAIGPFTGFRFPLWSWFAFTGLIALELAYYLR